MDALTPALLLSLLAHPSFDVREQASYSLRQGGFSSLIHIEHAATHSIDPEIRWRSDTLASEMRLQWACQVLPVVWPAPFPWIDHLPAEFPYRETVVRSYLNKTQPPYHGFPWQQYRLATSLFARDFLLARKSTTELVALLQEMAESERQWMKKNRPNDVP